MSVKTVSIFEGTQVYLRVYLLSRGMERRREGEEEGGKDGTIT